MQTAANQLIIGARGSKLSLWQANHIAALLCAAHPQITVSIRTYMTTGDRFLDEPLAQIGGKALFTKEIETAMLQGEVDLAVHSLKDMPAELPPGLVLSAVTKRHNPDDVLVSNRYDSLTDLPPGARLGTSSLRRKAQILSVRPDLTVVNVRGNVETRLRKLDNGEYDAIILAAAGLMRLGLDERITQVLSHELCLPAVGQGVLAIETRANDARVQELIACLEDAETRQAITAERAYLAMLEGNCQIPVGVFGQVINETLHLEAVILSLDGTRKLRDVVCGYRGDALRLGSELAEKMLAAGGSELLQSQHVDRGWEGNT